MVDCVAVGTFAAPVAVAVAVAVTVVVVVVVWSVAINIGLSNRKWDHRRSHFRYFRRSHIALVHFDFCAFMMRKVR